jgi:hypothetical protein
VLPAVPGASAKLADKIAGRRPLDEYCEWWVERDAGSGNVLIRRIVLGGGRFRF